MGHNSSVKMDSVYRLVGSVMENTTVLMERMKTSPNVVSVLYLLHGQIKAN